MAIVTDMLTLDGESIAGSGGASKVGYLPTGAGAVATTVQAKLRESVSVKDFGAVGDGVTNDTVAIQNAITAAGIDGAVFFPTGVYIVSATLTQLSGQTWYGSGEGSVIKLSSAITTIGVMISATDFATDCTITDMQIDGNRGSITPSTDLYNTFYMIRGARGGKRTTYKNLLLSNSWGRVLQTSNESVAEYAEDVVVENVKVVNAGTKAISATKTKRITISNCFAEVNPYLAANHPGGVGDGNASSGSCFECNDSHDVVLCGNHGNQVGTLAAPGIRIINESSKVVAYGNTTNNGSHDFFIQNVNDVDVFGNFGNESRGVSVLIADADADEPTIPCKRIDVHGNTFTNPASGYILTTAEKPGFDAFVEAYIYNNHFIRTTGLAPRIFFNKGVIAPATGGECLVYQWGNKYTGTAITEFDGDAPDEVQGEPNAGWRILGQSAVAVSHTGTTGEVTLATIGIPARHMGKNGRVRVTAHFSYPNNANNKITRVRFGGSQAIATTNTTTAQQKFQVDIANRNSTSSQLIGIPGNSSGFGVTTTALLTTAINTTAVANISISGQLADAADTITLESYTVELFHEI